MSKLNSNLVPFVPLENSTNSTNGHRYILEKGSKKHYCPRCTKKRFVRYVDTETNNYLPNQYGRCDRESNCAYHLNPYKDKYAKTQLQTDVEIEKIMDAGSGTDLF